MKLPRLNLRFLCGCLAVSVLGAFAILLATVLILFPLGILQRVPVEERPATIAIIYFVYAGLIGGSYFIWAIRLPRDKP